MACTTGEVISGADYLDVTTNYADLYTAMQGMKDYAWNALVYIVQLNDVFPEVDLVNSFWETYNSVTLFSNQPIILIDSVAAIERHVLERCGFTSVDEYISAEVPGAKVCQNWKVLSDLAGYTISNAYVDVSC